MERATCEHQGMVPHPNGSGECRDCGFTLLSDEEIIRRQKADPRVQEAIRAALLRAKQSRTEEE